MTARSGVGVAPGRVARFAVAQPRLGLEEGERVGSVGGLLRRPVEDPGGARAEAAVVDDVGDRATRRAMAAGRRHRASLH